VRRSRHGSQLAWGMASAAERADALLGAAESLADVAEDVAELTVREVGKTIAEARAEVERGVRILRFHAEASLLPDGETHPRLPPAPAGTITMSRRRPRGVAGLITPWNFPVAIPLWKAAPALAYGNAVLLKPASQAIATALRLGELLERHLPAGVLEVLPGGGRDRPGRDRARRRHLVHWIN
jgi:alpha-ketoglutaric semialdehyde dehydrogenase